MKKYVEILRNPSFLRFFLAQFISTLGDWMLFSVLIIFVYNLTGKAFSIALLAIFKILPAVVFTPFTAVIIDRFDRKRLMIFSDLARAFVIALLPFFPNLPYIFFTMFAMESFTILYLPARDSSIPTVVPKEHLIAANSLLTLTTNLTMILGFLFGSLFIEMSMGILNVLSQVAWFSGLAPSAQLAAKMVFFIDTFTFCASAFLIWKTALPPVHKARAVGGGGQSNWKRELADIWRFYTANVFVSTILITISILILGIGTIYALGVPYCDKYLGAGGQRFGYLIAALGIGMVFGSLAAEPLSKAVPRVTLFMASPFMVGACFFLFALIKNFMFALFLGAIAGFGLSTITVVTYAMLQQKVDNAILGRVFTAVVLAMRMSLIVSLIISSFVSDLISLFGVRIGPEGSGFLQFEVQGPVVTLFLGGVLVTWSGFYAMSRLWKRERSEFEEPESDSAEPSPEPESDSPDPAAEQPAEESRPEEPGPASGDDSLGDDDISALP